MSSRPRTPSQRPPSSHGRRPSSLDMSHNTPSRRHSTNRRSSGYSPMTPRSSHEFDHTFDGGADNGLGNLADELGGSDWDDDEEAMEGDDVEGAEFSRDDDQSLIGVALDHDGSAGSSPHGVVNGVPRDSGVAMQSLSPSGESKSSLSPQAAARRAGGKRRPRSLYDGSDYGDDSDLEANEGISAGMEKQLAAIESLARRGLEDNGSASDQVIKRFIEQLRDLGSQTSIENNTTRLKTACDALTGHLTHQSRTLTSVSSSFSGPRAIIPDPDTIDALLPLITSTLEQLPHSSNQPLAALSQLISANLDLLNHLSNIADSLHMSRQVQTNAARRLKTVKEQLADWKRESELRDQGMQFIEAGDWDRKLKEREAKAECGNVMQGFEEMFGVYRQRLCEGLGVANIFDGDEETGHVEIARVDGCAEEKRGEGKWKGKEGEETHEAPAAEVGMQDQEQLNERAPHTNTKSKETMPTQDAQRTNTIVGALRSAEEAQHTVTKSVVSEPVIEAEYRFPSSPSKRAKHTSTTFTKTRTAGESESIDMDAMEESAAIEEGRHPPVVTTGTQSEESQPSEDSRNCWYCWPCL